MVRGLTARILRQCGYTVIEAAGAADAIRSAGESSNKIDLLLTEAVLPDMNGDELAKTIGASYPGIKILFISGKPRGVGGILTPAQKELKFIQKPFMPEVLSRRIREILEG